MTTYRRKSPSAKCTHPASAMCYAALLAAGAAFMKLFG